MDKWLYSLIIVIAVSLTTIFLRLVPIIFFRKGNVPKWITYLGSVLPYAIMPILVMYCIKGTEWTTVNSVVPVIVSLSVTALIHLWRKNTVLSLIIGLGIYMILIRIL